MELGLQLLIITNVLAVILESVPRIREAVGPWLTGFETVSIGVFTVEYLARLWSAPAARQYGGAPLVSRVRFAVTPLALIDLLVILPPILGLSAHLAGTGLDLRVLRALRLLRLFRIAKLVRYVTAVRVIGRVLHDKREALTVVGVALMLLLIISASLMFVVEHEAQPARFATIPDAMWWAAATLTTVGYGDVYPVTPLGKVLGAVIALCGIAFFALPAGILGAGFLEAYETSRTRSELGTGASGDPDPSPSSCPRCGADLGRGLGQT